MKFRIISETRDKKDREIILKSYVRYDSITEVAKVLCLTKDEITAANGWAADAEPGDMLTIKCRRTGEEVMVVQIQDHSAVSNITVETVLRTVINKETDPDDRHRSIAARKGLAKKK